MNECLINYKKMDYDTVFKCYLSMKNDDCYALDALEMLIAEINESCESCELQECERLEILNYLYEWKTANTENKQQILEKLYQIFSTKWDFTKEVARYITFRMHGGKIEDYI